MEKFVEWQLDLLRLEQDEDIQTRNALLSTQSPNQLQKSGFALLGLLVVSSRTGLGGKTLVEFQSSMQRSSKSSSTSGGEENSGGLGRGHKFRNGDIVKLELSSAGGTSGNKNSSSSSCSNLDGSSKMGSTTSGVVWKVTDETITVAFGDQEEFPDGFDCLPVRLILLTNGVSYDRMRSALKSLLDQKVINSLPPIQTLFRLVPLITSSNTSAADDVKQNLYNPNLNDSQVEAVLFCLGAPHLAFVHGPPGTGKTSVLVEIVRQLAQPKIHPFSSKSSETASKRILVCAPSNLAVDNMVERLVSSPNPKLKVMRLGHPARILPSVLAQCLDYRIQSDPGTEIVADIRLEMDQLLAKLQKRKGNPSRNGGNGKQSQRSSNRKSEINRGEIYRELKVLRREYRDREQRVLQQLIGPSQTQIICCTLNGAGQRLLQNEMFDIVIIDEANQALQAECCIAMLKAKEKVIFAGDPFQLPPTVLSDTASKKGLSRTVFETLSLNYPKESERDMLLRLLTIQYRMHKTIMQWSSDAFYQGKLVADSSVAEHLLSQLPGVHGESDIIDVPMLFLDTTGNAMALESSTSSTSSMLHHMNDESKSNDEEARIVQAHLKTLIEHGVQESDIAIITPYNGQVSLLRSQLLPLFPGIEIGSVDSFQGREKEAVIISFVRCNDDHEIGFLSELRRTNVAITRARRHCCIIGNGETLSGGSKVYEKLVDYVAEHGQLGYPTV